jgi:hypothetical protein
VFSQTKTDNDIIFEKTTFVNSFESKREVTYLFAGKNAFIKYNPGKNKENI